jgi:hypothetical protein
MGMQEQPTVGQLVVAAFGLARNDNKETNQRWILISHRIGSTLPKSLLSISIQRLGEVDLLCRALEKELSERPPRDGELDFRFNYLFVLSEWWISSAYAVCFTLKDRKILTDADFLKLANDLRMIRVQIEKYEVPSDRRLMDPLNFVPTQLRADEKVPPIYQYDKNDRLRAHSPPRGTSARKSAMWEVFDIDADATRWYECRELSDRMLDLLDPPQETTV